MEAVRGRQPYDGGRFYETVKLLLDRGADVNERDQVGTTALFWAAHRRNLPMVRLLLDRGARVNARNSSGITPLMWAVLSEDPRVVHLLLEHGADVHVSVPGLGTPLTLAQIGTQYLDRRHQIVRLLEQAGAKK